ncbi:GntR family transcriptional regulator [Paenibacillus sp. KQZ6P-2]|uniref:GntR family transcriptional regulator n=1 Tax=Paenibacillus mangrovi TaxID=2931978 RepID=A0A9X1WLJ8_9BACL|nr:GntR family transcriptional regulator [Paenibacillus mangrovi]
MFELEHTELSEKVYQLLKKMILNREFVGGQRLDLRDLALKMNISRTPLKEAVNRLVLEGLMEVKPRSGTFVTTLAITDIDQVTEIRLMIEKWCVSHLTPPKAQELAMTLERILENADAPLTADPFDFQGFLELDVKFHIEIVKIGGNPRMLEHYKSLNSFLHAARVFFFQSSDRSDAGHVEHKNIVDAIKRFDLQEASTKLEEHILKSQSIMIEILKNSGGVL